jgi:hypothetical protein
MDRIRLGQRIRDRVSGLTGIATARLEYLNGCTQYCISPPVDKDGKRVEGWYVDQQTLELVDNGIAGLGPGGVGRADINAPAVAAATGGPSTREPRT